MQLGLLLHHLMLQAALVFDISVCIPGVFFYCVCSASIFRKTLWLFRQNVACSESTRNFYQIDSLLLMNAEVYQQLALQPELLRRTGSLAARLIYLNWRRFMTMRFLLTRSHFTKTILGFDRRRLLAHRLPGLPSTVSCSAASVSLPTI